MMPRFLPALLLIGLMASCQPTEPQPRPRAYPRVEWPVRGQTGYAGTDCPFTFNYPAYGRLEARPEPCWFDITMPSLNASLHCSYVPIRDRAQFDDLVKDAFVIAAKINERANYMEEVPVRSRHGAGGLALRWTGPAASPLHFFFTDSTTHFFRASLYFDARTRPDSLAPVVDFLMSDMDSLLASFAWRK